MAKNYIIDIIRSNSAKYVNYYADGNSPLIKDNAELYADIPYSGQAGTLRVYNSAILIYPDVGGNKHIFLTLISESGFELWEEYKDNPAGSWSYWKDDDFKTNYSGVYSRPIKYNGYSAQFNKTIYANFENVVQVSNSDTYEFQNIQLPIFYDVDEYHAYISNPYVAYVWSSVPAISGKNGVLSLPVLIDTDGNPVSNGSASDFSTLPDSVKVRTLADLAVQ